MLKPKSFNIVNSAIKQINDSKSLEIDIIDSIKKELFSMRSELFHPYAGMKILAYLDTIKFIQNNMADSMAFMKQNEVFNHALCKLDKSGLNAEFGVKKGKSIKLLSQKPKLKKQKIYGFDSFSGLPEDWTGTRTRAGRLKVSDEIPKLPKNIEIIKGWFKDSLPKFLKDHHEDFAFIHIDCDLYSSTKDIFDNIGKRITSGTVIIFDEYFNYPNWQQHEHKAFTEFVKNNNIKFEYLAYAHTQIAIRIL